jgi:hypothetical protein
MKLCGGVAATRLGASRAACAAEASMMASRAASGPPRLDPSGLVDRGRQALGEGDAREAVEGALAGAGHRAASEDEGEAGVEADVDAAKTASGGRAAGGRCAMLTQSLGVPSTDQVGQPSSCRPSTERTARCRDLDAPVQLCSTLGATTKTSWSAAMSARTSSCRKTQPMPSSFVTRSLTQDLGLGCLGRGGPRPASGPPCPSWPPCARGGPCRSARRCRCTSPRSCRPS